MTQESILDLFRHGLYLVVILSSIIVLPGFVVGLLVSMFQAATQINEMGLSFIPKFIVTLMTLVFAGPWMLNTLVSYTQLLITEIPRLIG